MRVTKLTLRCCKHVIGVETTITTKISTKKRKINACNDFNRKSEKN